VKTCFSSTNATQDSQLASTTVANTSEHPPAHQTLCTKSRTQSAGSSFRREAVRSDRPMYLLYKDMHNDSRTHGKGKRPDSTTCFARNERFAFNRRPSDLGTTEAARAVSGGTGEQEPTASSRLRSLHLSTARTRMISKRSSTHLRFLEANKHFCGSAWCGCLEPAKALVLTWHLG
jgi:hypothetical protein